MGMAWGIPYPPRTPQVGGGGREGVLMGKRFTVCGGLKKNSGKIF
jgi:hypothetical protein